MSANFENFLKGAILTGLVSTIILLTVVFSQDTVRVEYKVTHKWKEQEQSSRYSRATTKAKFHLISLECPTQVTREVSMPTYFDYNVGDIIIFSQGVYNEPCYKGFNWETSLGMSMLLAFISSLLYAAQMIIKAFKEI